MYKILLTTALLLVFGSSAYMSVSGLAAVFSTATIIILCLGAGLEIGKLLTVTYLHRQWLRLNWLSRAFYGIVILVLCVLTSLEVTGFLSQQYASMSQNRKVIETDLTALQQESEILKSQIVVIDNTLAGLPEGYVTRRIVERKQAGYDQKQERLLELTRQQAELEAGLVKDGTYAAPVFSVARIMGMAHDQAVRFLILLLVFVLEPLSIGLAVATSAVWQKPIEKGKKVLDQNAGQAEVLPEKMPEMIETAETAFSAKTVNPEKSVSYLIEKCRQNAGIDPTAKTEFPAFPQKSARPENTELHEIQTRYALTIERIAKITGRGKIKTVRQWLEGEKEIPEKALRELRKWTRIKNKVVPIKEAPYGI